MLAFATADLRDEDIEQTVSGGQMGIGEEVDRLADGRPGNLGRLAAFDDLGLGIFPEDVLQRRQQPGALIDAALIGSQTRVCGHLVEPEDLGEALPLLIAGDADEQGAVIAGFENFVDRPGAAP